MKLFLKIAVLFPFFFLPVNLIYAAPPSAVSTFESIGLSWSPTGGSSSMECNVRYRIAGTSEWRQGYPLWYDSRNSPVAQSGYRGSLVHLIPGQQYEIELSLVGTSTKETITASTWSEKIPIDENKTVYLPENISGFSINESDSGTSNGYKLYTYHPDNNSQSSTVNGTITIQSGVHHVIIRGLKIDANGNSYGINLVSSSDPAIVTHDIVIEKNEITDWGTRNYEGAVYSRRIENNDGVRRSNVERIIVQRNKMYDPHIGSNTWVDGHPEGAQAIVLWDSLGNHVFRYNDVYSNNNKFFNDGFGAGGNFGYYGFPNKDTDIYSNRISEFWDDGIEAEGANINVRIWGNYLGRAYNKIAVASTSVGPIYIWRNISGITYRSDPYGDDVDGGFLKNSTNSPSGGRIYVFHNTVLQNPPLLLKGAAIGYGFGGSVENLFSRNNIIYTWGRSIANSTSTSNDFDYDIYRTGEMPSGSEINGSTNPPKFDDNNNYSNGEYYLAADSSVGVDDGLYLPNFNDSYTADRGAHERGAPPMEFGVYAYTDQPYPTPTPTPLPLGSQLEAEFQNMTAAMVENEHAGFSGTGYVNFDLNGNGQIVWSQISVLESGNYALEFRYALGAEDRALKVLVNGQTLIDNLNFSSTGTWTNWSTQTIQANLNAGINTVTVQVVTTDGPNLDHLVVSQTLSPKPGDANSDGYIDENDYNIWLNYYNQLVSGSINGDFNNNDIVDGIDYVIWLNNFGK